MKEEQKSNKENVKNGAKEPKENNNIDKITKEQTVNNKIDKIKQIKNLKNKKIIIISTIAVLAIILISGITVCVLDVTNQTFGGKIANMFQSNNEISEEKATDKAIKRFKEMGEKNIKKDELEVLKILRKGEYYYYISSPENSMEIRITDGKIVRENSVLVEK